MFKIFSKLSYDHWFLIIAFCLSVLLSFAFGYTLFSYDQIDMCKGAMEFVDI